MVSSRNSPAGTAAIPMPGHVHRCPPGIAAAIFLAVLSGCGDLPGHAPLVEPISLVDLAWTVSLEENESLASLQGLENLRSARYCWVRSNPSLCDSLVVQWMAGLEITQDARQEGNRVCRQREDGAEPPPRP